MVVLQKRSSADGKVRNRVCSLLPQCPNRPDLSGVTTKLKSRVLCVRWYLTEEAEGQRWSANEDGRLLTQRFTVGYRNMRSYLDKRCRPQLKPTNDTGVVLQKLHRATRAYFLLTAKRNVLKLPNAFSLRRSLRLIHKRSCVINVDTVDKGVGTSDPNNLKNAAYPKAEATLKAEDVLSETTELRQNKYLNNIVEQDHRFIKRLTLAGMGFQSFNTQGRTLSGCEALNIIRTGQISLVEKGDVRASVEFVSKIFAVAA